MANSINGDMDGTLDFDPASALWIAFQQRLDLTVETASPRIEEFTGVSVKHWKNDPSLFWQVVDESDATGLKDHLENSPETVKETSFRLRNQRSGRVAYVWEIRRPLLSSNGQLRGYECVWLDMTRRILAEQRMSSACWKETLSTLTIGLTHDFNNSLAGILSTSDFLLTQTAPGSSIHEALTLIRDNSRKAAQVVQLLGDLHRAKPGERSYHDLNEIVRSTVSLLERAIRRRITIVREFHEEVLAVHADAVDLQQAIVHIGLNAADAMPDHGTLTFQTSLHLTSPQDDTSQGALPQGPCVCLPIKDTGLGLRTKRPADAFDPYYTTKASNKGTGLGLPQAKQCVDQNDGAITVDSTPQGTTFKIWLPQADLSEPDETDPGEAEPRPKSFTTT